MKDGFWSLILFRFWVIFFFNFLSLIESRNLVILLIIESIGKGKFDIFIYIRESYWLEL